MVATVGIVFILIIVTIIIMGNNKTSAKDFFLHLGAMAALYTVAISFLNLVFKIINKAFPEVSQNIYAWGGGSEISMPVATLIVVFPIFMIISRMVRKIYMQNPGKKELGIRKWITYITLFVAGILLTGDLVTVLYKFLDGQDLTAAFLLKALSVLIVASGIFWYYLQDIRDNISPRRMRSWAISSIALILLSIVLGFAVLGSPRTQRLLRYDNQKIIDLQNIQWQVISYWQMNGAVPIKLDEVEAQRYALIPKDPQTGESYKYKKTGMMTFQLCAEFNREDMTNQYTGAGYPVKVEVSQNTVIQNENWNHSAGIQCFERVIDPTIYPTRVRG